MPSDLEERFPVEEKPLPDLALVHKGRPFTDPMAFRQLLIRWPMHSVGRWALKERRN